MILIKLYLNKINNQIKIANTYLSLIRIDKKYLFKLIVNYRL